MTTREHLAWLLAYWRPHRLFALLLLFMTLMSTAVAVAFPLVWGVVIDGLHALPPGGRLGDADLGRYSAILGAIALGRFVAGLYPGLRALMNMTIEKAVRERVFSSILDKDHTFFGRFRTGDLVTRLTDDIADYPRIAWFTCSGIFRFLDSISRVLFCVGAMFLTCDASLALLSLIPVPLMLWVFYLARRDLGATYERQQAAVSRTNDTLEAALSGIKIVKAFNGEPGQQRRLAAILDDRIGIQMRLARLVALVHQGDNIASRLGQVVVLAVGGGMVIDGRLSLGTLFALHLYLDMLVQPMMDLPNLFVAARQAFVSVDREVEILRHPPVLRATAPPAPPLESIACGQLGFRYRPDAASALDEVSFEVPRGSRVAVVGAVASGKSTLLRVLAGLLPPTGGSCAYNGRPLGAWEWASLRARIGYVPQESLLFSETIAENVAFGRAVSASEVEECLGIAQMAADVAAMPDGAATRLGRLGTLVSGGQKQRIAIARALAGRPDLLLFDDCTSSLDARNEESFWQRLLEARPGVTVFVVSHRLATVRRAGLILVLDRGRLVDRGTHEDLAGRCAAYREFLLTEERRSHLERE